MPTHWTYTTYNAQDDLFQGDILTRTPELEEILNTVHAHFVDSKFTHFVVITQTCDLVKRGSTCKAEQVGLAVVRELGPLLPAIVEAIAGFDVAGVYRHSARKVVIDQLKKIINQNELSRGLFYLHPDGDLKIAAPSVATLRINIALDSARYKVLQDARCGRLTTEFSNKLGWLCGNLFSRIATPDWNEAEHDAMAGDSQAKRLLQSIDGQDNKYWVPERWIEAARKAKVLPLVGKSRDEVLVALKSCAPPEPIETALLRIRDTACRIRAADQALTVQHSVLGDSTIRDSIKLHLSATIEALAGVSAALNDVTTNIVIKRAGEFVLKAVRLFLEKPGQALTVLQDDLAATTIHPQAAKALRSAVRGAHSERWPSIEPQLTALEAQPFFPNDVIGGILGRVRPLATEHGTADIDKLVNRLRNDTDFAQLFRESQPVLFTDPD
jgi:hypothetical protein